jgi:hypothetical protein
VGRKQLRKPPAKSGLQVHPTSQDAPNADSLKALLSFELFKSPKAEPESLSKEQVRSFFAFMRKVTERTWIQILQSGGKQGDKAGLGYTALSNNPLSNHPGVGPDETVSEMRVTQTFRVFGVRRGQAYFLLCLDPDHEMFPG